MMTLHSQQYAYVRCNCPTCAPASALSICITPWLAARHMLNLAGRSVHASTSRFRNRRHGIAMLQPRTRFPKRSTLDRIVEIVVAL